MSRAFEARLDRTGASPTVWLHGVFDRDAVTRFHEVMQDTCDDGKDVVVDVSHVTDASVDAAEAIVTAVNDLASEHRRLVLIGRPALLRHLMKLGVADLVKVSRPARWTPS